MPVVPDRSIEPPERVVVVTLSSILIGLGCAVWLEVISTVLEGDFVASSELILVPLCDLGVSEQSMVAAEEARLDAACDVVVSWVIFTRRIGRELPIAVLRLIDREPFIYKLIVALNDEGCIIEVVVDDLAIVPGPVLVEQRKRSIPVEKCNGDLDAVGDQLSNDIVVMSNTSSVDWTLAKGENTRPTDTRGESGNTKSLQTSKVLLVEVVVGSHHISSRVVCNKARNSVTQQVPDTRPFTLSVCSTLLTVSSGRDRKLLTRSPRFGMQRTRHPMQSLPAE